MINTREQWLNALVDELTPMYKGELPDKVHVSVGFPSKGIRSKTIGECWSAGASADGAPQIFVHPKLSDPVEVASVIVHELIHAARPAARHGAGFKSLAVQIGLEGKMIATHPGESLIATLRAITDKIGPYPHPMLSGSPTVKKQSTRLIKAECPECGYTIRTTAKWIETGLPSCPCNGVEMRLP